MKPAARNIGHRHEDYFTRTRRPLYSLAFVLPVLLLFQVGRMFYQVDVLVPEDFAGPLTLLGATMPSLMPAIVAAALLIQHLVKRHRWRIHPIVLGPMAVESILGVLPLLVLGTLTNMILAHDATTAMPQASAMGTIVRSAGVATYEEFLFRLLGIGLLIYIVHDVFEMPRKWAAPAAVILAAALFALYHMPANKLLQEVNIPAVMTFRALAGAYLGIVYLTRGFGIAVGIHVLYNIYVQM